MKKFIFFILLAVITASCGQDPNVLVYYDTEGYGYVYNENTREPVPNARVRVHSGGFPAYTYGTTTHTDYFYTDSTGFYRMRFLKSKGGEKAKNCTISASVNNRNTSSSYVVIHYDSFSNQQSKIKIDTIFVEIYDPLNN